MNIQRPIRKLSSRLTRKYQATIPQPIRDALGLKAGDLVNFSIDENGRAMITPASDDDRIEDRKQQIIKGVMEARRLFKAENTLPEGMTSDEWYQLMRGPPAEV